VNLWRDMYTTNIPQNRLSYYEYSLCHNDNNSIWYNKSHLQAKLNFLSTIFRLGLYQLVQHCFCLWSNLINWFLMVSLSPSSQASGSQPFLIHGLVKDQQQLENTTTISTSYWTAQITVKILIITNMSTCLFSTSCPCIIYQRNMNKHVKN
jgi:hypothetical protein